MTGEKFMATIRFATPEDVPIIYTFIMALAEYEQLAHEVAADIPALRETLFGAHPSAEEARIHITAVGRQGDGAAVPDTLCGDCARQDLPGT